MPAVDRRAAGSCSPSAAGSRSRPTGTAARSARSSGAARSPRWPSSGIRTIFYLQVDNPLIAIGDPGFLGVHRRPGAEMSSKVVRKTDPAEKVGLVVVRDGRQEMIEYSDLPDELARAARARRRARAVGRVDRAAPDRRRVRGAAGGRRREAAVPSRAQAGAVRGRARERRSSRQLRTPSSSSSSSSTRSRWPSVRSSSRPTARPSSSRSRTRSGPASPETVRGRLSALYAGWLEAAGVAVPRGADGSPEQPIEISPLVALDAAELAGRVDPAMARHGPRAPFLTHPARARGHGDTERARVGPCGRCSTSCSRRGAPCAPRRRSRSAERAWPVCRTSPGRRARAAAVPPPCRSASAASAAAAGWGSSGRPPLSPTRAAGRELVRQLKSGRRRALAGPAGAAIATLLGGGGCEAVCWVPGDWWRTIQRGCHPAELLAREVARAVGAARGRPARAGPAAAAAAGAGHGRPAGATCAARSGRGPAARARGRGAGRRRLHDRRHARRLRAGAPGRGGAAVVEGFTLARAVRW